MMSDRSMASWLLSWLLSVEDFSISFNFFRELLRLLIFGVEIFWCLMYTIMAQMIRTTMNARRSHCQASSRGAFSGVSMMSWI